MRKKNDRPATEDEIPRALFGRTSGGAPKEIREHLGFAADAINAHQRGLSVPQVALNYRYEPIQAMSMIANCCDEYGFAVVAHHVPGHAATAATRSEARRRASPRHAQRF